MISICVPTRGRPERFAAMVDQARRLAAGKVEVVARLDDDDPSEYPELKGVLYVRGPRRLRDGHTEMSGLWTEAWEAASGDYAMLCGDDALFLTRGWDTAVTRAFERVPDRILMVYANDGSRNPRPIMPFVSREWIEAVGYFTPPDYPGWYADNWIWSLAVRLERVVFLPAVRIEHDYRAGEDQTYRDGAAAREAAGGNDALRARFNSLDEVRKREEQLGRLRARMGRSRPLPPPNQRWVHSVKRGEHAARQAIAAEARNAKTLVAVHCYAGDLDQVRNGLHVHQAHGCQVVIVSPTDAPVELPGADCIQAGLRGYTGQVTLDRQRAQLQLLLDTYPHEWMLLNDSDSFCLAPIIPEYLYRRTDVLWSNEVPERRPHPSPYPKIAFHPPYFAHRSVIEQLLTVDVPAHPITPFIDWYMVALACEAGVRHAKFPDGKSMCAWRHGKLPKTELQDDDFKHVQLDEGGRDGGAIMRQYVLRGANLVHAVKHADVLASLEAAYAERTRPRARR